MEIKKRKSIYSNYEKADWPFVYAMIALPVIQCFIFWFCVKVDSIGLAFQTPTGEFTWQNFKDVWTAIIDKDVYYGFNVMEMLGRSLSLWAIANLVTFPLALMSTYVLFRKVLGHYVFRVCYSVPGLVGAVVWTASVQQMMGHGGAVIYILEAFGADLPALAVKQGLFAHIDTAFPAIFWMTFILGLAGGNVVITGAYARIPGELYEVGKLEGIGFWTEWFKVALPCAWPTVAMQITLNLCGIFVADGNVFLYSQGTGEPGMATMGYYLYFLTYKISNSAAANLPYGYPSALGLFLTAITVPLVLFGRWLLERLVEPVET